MGNSISPRTDSSIWQHIADKVWETCSDLGIDLDDYAEFRLFVSAKFTKAHPEAGERATGCGQSGRRGSSTRKW